MHGETSFRGWNTAGGGRTDLCWQKINETYNIINTSWRIVTSHNWIYATCTEEPEKAMAPHSSTLAWKIPRTEEPGGLLSMGSPWVGHNWATSLSLFTFMHWRRKWQPTPVFLPGESQGWGSLVGCHLWGRIVRHNWSDLAAAALRGMSSLLWGICILVWTWNPEIKTL